MVKQGYHHGNLRQALVESAIKLIEARGPTGFSLSEAAKQAGVTPAAVYRHFEGRDDLIAEVALEGYKIFADLMQFAYDKGQPSALAAFEATGRAYLAFARRYPGYYISMFESGISVIEHLSWLQPHQKRAASWNRLRKIWANIFPKTNAPQHLCSVRIF